MEPKISVVLTTHEAYSKYLKRAVDSVLQQTFGEFELIVVKDGGTPEDWLKDYDPRIKYIHQEENFGQHTRPKNIGTLLAQGKYICYLDADNAYRPDHLQALYRQIIKLGVTCVYGDRMVIDARSKQQKPGVKSDFDLGLLAQRNYIDTSDVLAEREAVLAVGGWDESLQYFADWNLWVRMAKAGYTFRHINLMLTDYYFHGKNNVLKAKTMNFDVQGCLIWPEKTSIGKPEPLKVAIFMLTYDRLSYTIETVESMYEKTKYPFDLYIIDNGSTDKTPIWLADNEKKYGYQYVLLGENTGISHASNFALDIIGNKYDVIGKVDNDLYFITPNWLEEIMDIYARSRGVVVSPYIEGLIDHPGGSPRMRTGYIDKHYVGIVSHLGGACCFAPSRVYKQFRWPEKDFLHGMQDSLFSQEMNKKGLVLLYEENIRVQHCFNTSFSEKGVELEKEEEKLYRLRRKDEKVRKYGK